MSIDPDSSFYVVLHDVTPRFADWTGQIAESLQPLIGSKMSAAVVPQWHGDAIEEHTADFVAQIKSQFDKILLHGYYHQRINSKGFVYWMTDGADEFNDYNREETSTMLQKGQQVMLRQYGARADGFISPTFARGALSKEILAEQGLKFCVGMRKLEFQDGETIPLATWCWDMGKSTFLGHLGDVYGYARMNLYRNLLPCLAIHPIDIQRGFLPKITKLVNRLLEQGRKPILIGEQEGE